MARCFFEIKFNHRRTTEATNDGCVVNTEDGVIAVHLPNWVSMSLVSIALSSEPEDETRVWYKIC